MPFLSNTGLSHQGQKSPICWALPKSEFFPQPAVPQAYLSNSSLRPTASRSIFLQTLEPRLLLSADIAPAAGQALLDGLDELSNWADELSEYDELIQPLPIVDKSISDLLNLGSSLREALVSPLQGLDFNDSEDLRAALEAALQVFDGSNTVADLSDSSNLEFEVDFHREVAETLPFGLGEDAEALGIDFTSDVNASAFIDFNFSFGLDLDPTLNPTDAFFIDLSGVGDEFSVGLSINVPDIDFGFDLGFIEAMVVDSGMLEMTALLDVNLPGSGPTTLSDLTNTTIDTSVLMPSGSSSFSINLPIEASLTGFSGGSESGALQVSGVNASNLFDTPDINVSVSNPILKDFTNIKPGDVVGMLEGLGSQVEAFADILDISGGIPFVGEAISTISDYQSMVAELSDGLFDLALNAIHEIDLAALTGATSFDISLDGGAAKTINLNPAGSVNDLLTALNAELDSELGANKVQAILNDNGQLQLKTVADDIEGFSLSNVSPIVTAALGLEDTMLALPFYQFTTLQDLESLLDGSGLLDQLFAPNYDPTSNSILFTLDMSEVFAKSILMNFNESVDLGVAELLLAGGASAQFSVEAGIDLTAGIDISVLAGTTLVGDLNGGIGVNISSGDDIAFQFQDGSVATVDLSALDSTGDDLINEDDEYLTNPVSLQVLIDQITTQTASKVAIDIDPARANLTYTDQTAGTDDFIMQAVAVGDEPASGALIDLGVILFGIGNEEGVITGGALLDRLFVQEGSSISADASISAADIDLTGALGFLEIGVEDGELTETTIEAAVNLQDPFSDGRIFLDELARKALDGDDELYFLSALSPTFNVTTGMLSLPLVFPDADSFGLDTGLLEAIPTIDITFMDVVEAGPGGLDITKLIPDVSFDTTELEALLTSFENMSVGQLLNLVLEIGQSLAEDFDLFNTQLPLVDASINDLVNVVNNGIDSIFEAGELGDKIQNLKSHLNNFLDTHLGQFDGDIFQLTLPTMDPALAGKLLTELDKVAVNSAGNLVAANSTSPSLADEFYAALNALLESINLLPEELDILTVENPTQLIASFKSFLLVASKVKNLNPNTLDSLTDLTNAEANNAITQVGNALDGFIGEAKELIPSSDTILKLIFEAVGFELPDLADVLTDLDEQAIKDLLTDTLDTAIAAAKTELEGLASDVVSEGEDIQPAIDALGEADQVIDRIVGLLSDLSELELMDFVRLFGLSTDLLERVETAINNVSDVVDALAAGTLKTDLQMQLDNSLKMDIRDKIEAQVLAEIQNAFDGNLLTFRFDSNNNLLLNLHIAADAFELTDTDNMFALDFELFGPSDPIPLNFESEIMGEVNLGGALELGFGLNVDDVADPKFYLQTSSSAELTLGIDIEGYAELSLFALSVAFGNPNGMAEQATIMFGSNDGGMVEVDGMGDVVPAALTLDIVDNDGMDDGLIMFGDINSATFDAGVDAFLDVSLPVYTNGTAVEAADGDVEVIADAAPDATFTTNQVFSISVNGGDPVQVSVPPGPDVGMGPEYGNLGALLAAINTALDAANFTDMGIFNDGDLGDLFNADSEGGKIKLVAVDDQVASIDLSGAGLATLGFTSTTANTTTPVELGVQAAITGFDADGFDFDIDPLTPQEVSAILGSFTELNLANLFAAIETILQLLDEGLGADFLDDIPIIDDAADLMGDAVDLLNNGFDTLQALVESIPNDVVDLAQWVEDRIDEALAAILNDASDPIVGVDDVRFSLNDFVSEIDTSTFTMNSEVVELLTDPDLTVEVDLGFNFNRIFETDFDLGFDALIFDVETAGGVDVVFDASMDLILGLGLQKGPYLKLPNPADMPDVAASLDVDVDGALKARLFFLELMATPKVGVEHAGEANEVEYEGVNFDATVGVDFGTGEITDFDDDLGFDLSFETELNIDLLLEAGVAGLDDTMPNIEVFMNTDWMLVIDETGVTSGPPSLEFNDLTLDLGQFFDRTFGPVLDQLEPFTSPLQPIFAVLDTEIPVVSDLAKLLGQDPITFGTAISLLGSGFESVQIFLNVANNVNEILDLIDGLADGGKINFGDMDFAGVDVTDPANSDLLTNALATVDMSFDAVANMNTESASLVTTSSSSAGFDTDGGLGIQFDIFDNPASIFNLLLGETAPLVTWDIPRLAAEFNFGASFGPIIPPIPLFATINLGTEIFADFSIGFDTRGLQTGTFLNGFHFDDWDENGDDILELGLAIEASAGAKLSVVVASAGVNGGVRAEIGANWHDNDNDGNVYLDELALNFSRGIECVFDLEGALNAFFDAFVKIGLDTPFGFITLFEEVLNLLEVTILDFSLSCPPLPPPVPATLDSDMILLNIGDRAGERQPGATDGDETILVVSEFDRNGDGIFAPLIDINENGVIEETELLAAEDLDGNGMINSDVIGVLGFGEYVQFNNLNENTVIKGNGGAGEDSITIDASVVFDTVLTGGDGDDFIQGGSGQDEISGDAGEDELIGGLGNDEIHGGANNDMLKGNAGNDMLWGDGGDDIVHGEDGINGDRNGSAGDADNDLIAALNVGLAKAGYALLIAPPGYDDDMWGGDGADDLRGDFGVDDIYGEDGNDKIVGGFGNDRLRGGDETDLVEGSQGSDQIWGDNDDGTGIGDDILFGEGGGVMVGQTGDDIIFGGRGKDTIRDAYETAESAEEDGVEGGDDSFYGGDGDDLLVTGVGNDRAFGGIGNDEIQAGDGNNYVEGGAGHDRIFTGVGHDLIIGGSSPFKGAFDDNFEQVGSTYTGPTDDGFGGDIDTGDVKGPSSTYFVGGNVGGDGADTIQAGAGDDIVLADNGAFYTSSTDISTQTRPSNLVRVTTFAASGQGADSVYGGTGEDIIFGGGDDDRLFGDNTGGTANDIVVGDQGFMTATQLVSGFSLVAPSSGNDKLYGRGGLDILIGGGGNDILHGDAGDDTLAGDYVALTIVDVDGFVQQGGNVDITRVTSINTDKGGHDYIYGSLGADTAVGGVEDDFISGGGNSDTGLGSDILLGDNGEVVFDDLIGPAVEKFDIFSIAPDDSGQDIIIGSGRQDIIIGGGDDDDLYGLQASDVVLGDHGHVHKASALEIQRIETLFKDKGGDDFIRGNEGDDVLIGGMDSDEVEGNDGVDIILGDNGEVVLGGLVAGEILIQGNAVALIKTTDTDATTGAGDLLFGNANNDVIAGGVAGDTIHGNDGDDIILGDNGTLDWTYDFTADPFFPNGMDTDLNTLDLITTQLPAAQPGGRDTIYGDDGGDVVFGGTDADTIYGDDGDNMGAATDNSDVLFGDHGRIYPQHSTLADFPSENFFAIDTGDNHGAAGDRIFGEQGDDILLGQQGDDRMFGGSGDDDMIGGHNVAGGIDELSAPAVIMSSVNPDINDIMDGGSGDDALAGDNATIWRTGDVDSPRIRVLEAELLYEPSDNLSLGDADVTDSAQADPNMAVGRNITLLDHDDTIANQAAGPREFGDDYIAGNADNDILFGQLGEDVLAGDGSVDDADPGLPGPTSMLTTTDAGLPDTGGTLYFNVFESHDDGDDYIEGNGGSDLIYGGLGQDDIIGGSSDMFGLDTPAKRPDTGDIIYGGAANPDRLTRNDFTADNGDIIADVDRHAVDADVILGDNGNIYRIVGTNNTDSGSFLTYNYDAEDPARGDLRIVVRAIDRLDYDPDLANPSIGGNDLIHGESGDDMIHAMIGNDIAFGEADDDDIYGEAGMDWLSGGTGQDGVLGDDGLISTSRNASGYGESLYGISAIPNNQLNLTIKTPGSIQQSIINVAGELKKTVDLTPFDLGDDDIIYGGLGSDFLHGGAGDDAMSGAEALPVSAAQVSGALLITGYDTPVNPGDVLGFEAYKADEFALYDEFNPLRKIMLDAAGNATADGSGTEFLLNFEAFSNVNDQVTTKIDDGNDVLFGDDGNDWLVGGTGQDRLYGGYGSDLMNTDDNLATNGGENDLPDVPEFSGTTDLIDSLGADMAFGGAGRDVLINNTGADRLIDWVGEFNSYVVPFAPFGQFDVSRSLQPQLRDYLYDLSESDGADPTRSADTGADAARNGEPEGELGLVLQQDFDWQEQTGAPDDPQAGNIPGGKRDVMEAEDFNDGVAALMAVDSGDWTVKNGSYQGTSISHGDAVSLFFISDPLPGYYEILATVNANKDKAGYKSNGFVIFDYHSDTDFKFAGIEVGTDKLQIGQRTADGWIVDTQSNMQLKPKTNYNLLVAVNGTTVTLVVNNQKALSHSFDARVIDGFSYGLNSGLIAVGTNNAVSRFDNLAVQKLPPDITYESVEDFSDGIADGFSEQYGSWAVSANQYLASDVDGNAALSTYSLEVATNSFLGASATLATDGISGLIFDSYGAGEYKFAALSVAEDQVIIGHYTERSGLQYDTAVSIDLAAGTEYMLDIALQGTTVSVSVDGQAVLGHVFNALLNDGDLGLLSIGESTFDQVTTRTDDPAYEVESLMAVSVASESGWVGTLELAQLEPIVTAAIAYWQSTGLLTEQDQALLNSVEFEIADLSGLTLAQTRDTTVVIDDDAAGHGWFVDLTPEENSEFSTTLGDGVLQADDSSIAYGDMDLLTAVIHELGHVLGLEHYDTDLLVMQERLESGTRVLDSSVAPAREEAVIEDSEDDSYIVMDDDGEWAEQDRSAQIGMLTRDAYAGRLIDWGAKV